MKKTITTQSRITTCIMSWRGRIAGAISLAFIFFIGCTEDETNLLGFPTGANKFKVFFQELSVPSSLITVDSIRTINDPRNLRSPNRLMVGRYVDPQFGVVNAEFYTQIRPADPSVNISSGATLISAALTLTFDYYYYGSQDEANDVLFVHELLEDIPDQTPFFSNSSLAFNTTPLGMADFIVSPVNFDINFKDNQSQDTSLHHLDTLSVPIDLGYAAQIFDVAKSGSTAFNDFAEFKNRFKGLVVTPGGNNSKIVGFNAENTVLDPNSLNLIKPKSLTRLVLVYEEDDPSTGTVVRKELEFFVLAPSALIPQVGFTRITADRSGTPIDPIQQTHTPFTPFGGIRHFQSGSVVMPKLDFTNFVNFVDTIPNVVFNSVELSIPILNPENFPPPDALRLRVLNAVNRFKKEILFPLNPIDSAIFNIFPASITLDEENWYIMGVELNQNTISENFDLKYLPEEQRYSGNLTEFFQGMARADADEVITDFGLIAINPYFSKSVNRFTFREEDVKLKMFYTIPLSNTAN